MDAIVNLLRNYRIIVENRDDISTETDNSK